MIQKRAFVRPCTDHQATQARPVTLFLQLDLVRRFLAKVVKHGPRPGNQTLILNH